MSCRGRPKERSATSAKRAISSGQASCYGSVLILASKVPAWASLEDDPECDSTATEEACLNGRLQLLRRFKLNPETDNLVVCGVNSN